MAEKSCGVVLYRMENGAALYLLLHYPAGHWDFPKGHIEEGENELQTAMRELREETGIENAEFEPEFREKISYFYRREGKPIYKEVFFFLARTDEKEVRVSHEHQGHEWLAYPEAQKRVTYKNSKGVLEKAGEKIEG